MTTPDLQNLQKHTEAPFCMLLKLLKVGGGE